ncbi:hypothetical protein AB990_19030 [Alkalihalobacillus pseudalcaliphilus]|nr:hypothetical protein AB990_19030 [Alkalihalobacillus pseudalcaliphilus]
MGGLGSRHHALMTTLTPLHAISLSSPRFDGNIKVPSLDFVVVTFSFRLIVTSRPRFSYNIASLFVSFKVYMVILSFLGIPRLAFIEYKRGAGIRANVESRGCERKNLKKPRVKAESRGYERKN